MTAESTFTWKGGSYSSSNSIEFSGGKITCYVAGKLLDHEVFNISKDFLKGWSRRINY